jgi:pimeloyl-ACP methyl ester carboxylesterase
METVTSADGTTIAFDQLGSGPPLVLVAGASCDRGQDQPIADALAQDFTVLNHDRRGRGDSSDATSPATYVVERELEDLAVLIDAAGGAAVLVGLSSGGALAARAAAAGLPVRQLVMWEPPFQVDPAGQRGSLDYQERLYALLAQDRRGDALALFMSIAGVPEEMVAGARQSPWWPVGEGMAHTLAYDAAVMGDASVPAAYADIDCPALILTGGDSPPFFAAGAEAAAAAIPGGRAAVLAGQTHNVDAAVLSAAVRDFVKESS